MPGNALSVLVVDDDESVVKSIVLSLKRTSWNVQSVPTAKAALEIIRTTPPQVLLCDAGMPDITGAQLITMIKSDPGTARVRAVLMTGLSDANMFSHVPWDGFLAKPFGPKELRHAIESAVKKP